MNLFNYLSLEKQKALKSSKVFNFFEAHWFFLVFSTGIAAIFFVFKANTFVFPATIGFLLPGYFLSKYFFSDSFYRTVLSFPFSAIVFTAIIYASSLFFVPTINIIAFTAVIVLSFLATFILKPCIFFPKIKTKILLLLAATCFLALIQYNLYAGADFSSEMPKVVASDHSFDLTIIEWMVSSEKYSLPPWLSPTDTEILSANAPPASMVGPSMFAKIGGFFTHSALTMHQGLIFVSLIIMVFFSISYIFKNDWIAFLSAVFLAFPAEQFLWADLSGMIRITLGMVFVVMAAAGAYFFWHKEENAEIFLGIALIGVSFARPPDILSLIGLGPFFALSFFSTKNKTTFLHRLLVVIAISLVGFVYIIPAFMDYGNSRISELQFQTIEEFEKQAVAIGPVIPFENYVIYAAIFALSIAFLVSMVVLFRNDKISLKTLSDDRTAFIFSGIILLALTIGIIYWGAPHLPKWRHIFYGFFFAPPVLLSIQLIAEKAAKFQNIGPLNKKAITGLVVCFLIIAPHFNNFFPSTYLAGNKINENNFSAIAWVRENTAPSDTVVSINDLRQATTVLTFRPSTSFLYEEENPENPDLLKTTFNQFCFGGFVFENFFFKQVKCEKPGLKFTEFNYVILIIVEEVAFEKNLLPLIEGQGYAIVFSKSRPILLEGFDELDRKTGEDISITESLYILKKTP